MKCFISTASIFNTRTRHLYHAHTQLLNKQLFKREYMALPRDQRKHLTLEKYVTQQPAERRAELPFDLDFLRQQIRNAIGKNCPYCREELTLRSISLDHQIPLSRRAEPGLCELLEPLVPASCSSADWFMGGKWYSCGIDVGLLMAAFSWANVVICCLHCNLRKGEMWSQDFIKLQECLGTLTNKSALYVRRQLAMKAHWFGRKGDAK